MRGWIQALAVCLSAHLALTGIPRTSRISPYIKHYEVLTYSTERLHADHERVRREAASPLIYLNFTAHNKVFNLRLQQHSSVFIEEPELALSSGHVVPLDISHIYEGDLIGERNTHIHGSIIDGVFAGVISTPNEGYTVERSDVYFKDPHDFHSIIYRDSHMDLDPHRSKRSVEKEFCGAVQPEIQQWMQEQKNALIHEVHKTNSLFKDIVQGSADSNGNSYHDSGTQKQKSLSEEKESPAVKYLPHTQRSKREVLNKGTCNLYLRSDTVLWERYTGKGGHGLDYEDERARKEITSLFSQMVSEVNKIYNGVQFSNTDGSISYSGISLKIHRVKINETSRDCPGGSFTPGKPLCNPNIDVHNFLNYNSLEDNDEFCLAYTVTFRDFDGGTLGLAWTGDAGEAPGGICDKYKKYQSISGNSIVMKGLNTGIVSLVNYNVPVAPNVAYLTLAHEIGHNFGSPHDFPSECVPFTANGDANGNFIMYASATTGDQRNNAKFSGCSKRNISLVLNAVINEKHDKKNCFISSGEAFCGNQIQEGTEECDCGYADDCRIANDVCCTPRNEDGSRGCTRIAGKTCSPSEGPCCSDLCTIITPAQNYTCAKSTDCQEETICNGATAKCPAQVNRPDDTTCNENTQVCKNGVCQGSICEKISWSQCYLERSDIGDSDSSVLCFVACKNPTGDCISTGDKTAMDKTENKALSDLVRVDLKKESLKLKAGAPCDNLKGYCDAFDKCELVDADGILNRLKNFFTKANLNEIKDWIIKHWWAVLLIGVGFIIVMGVFIKLCAVHTPSHNPEKKPARKLTKKGRHHQERAHRNHDRPRSPHQDQHHLQDQSYHSRGHDKHRHGGHHRQGRDHRSHGSSNPAYSGSRDYPESHYTKQTGSTNQYSRPPPYDYM